MDRDSLWQSDGPFILPLSVPMMDRGRPVRKSSAACWPGIGRTRGSQGLDEWRNCCSSIKLG
jgi:hypothetical protein